MHRRSFVARSLATTSAAVLGRHTSAQSPSTQSAANREFYLLRRYHLVSGPQVQLAETYLSTALLPALDRLGCTPAGAFRLDFGPETPTFYLLVPSTSVDTLVTLDTRLADDPTFQKAAQPFWNAPAAAPAFSRIESSLLHSFSGWPRLVPPPFAATHTKHIVQLRTYESPSLAAHLRKVEMFNSGEFAIFQKAGANPVFFAQDLVGNRLPSLTYMLSFPNATELDAAWARFSADPDWKKLSTDPHYSYEPIVSNISNLILSPLAGSRL